MYKSFFRKISLLLIFSLSLTACIQAQESRPITSFHTLKVSGLAVVYLSHGESKEAFVKVSGMPIEDLVTEQEDGVLTITTKGRHSGESIRVEVSTNQLKKVVVGGAAYLITKEPIQTDRLDIVVKGAGEAKLELDVNVVTAQMKGAADLTLSGITGHQQIISAGSRGSLDNRKLKLQPERALNTALNDIEMEEESFFQQAIDFLFQ